jgi:hypothetical protein
VIQLRRYNAFSFQPGKTMRLCAQILAVAIICFAAPALAQTLTPPANPSPEALEQHDPDIDLYALMSGKCTTLKVAGHNFACKAVGFFHSEKGRVNFAIALDDPADNSHIISFSGENGNRTQANLYELPIDRMLLSSKDRPKADGLPVPSVELSAGFCRQLGNFAARQVDSISCAATDKSGKKYELQFQSDGLPISVRRVRQTRPTIKGGDPFE